MLTVLLGAFAVPAAGLAGIASTISFLIIVFSPASRSAGIYLFFVAAAAICLFAVRVLWVIAARGRQLVEAINAKESLRLNPAHMLGHPGPAFLVFDKAHRTIAVCNSVTGDYKLHAFSYVLQWYYEWGVGRSMNVGIAGGPLIPGTNMREPNITHAHHKKNFTLVLEVADVDNPQYKFPMQGEA